ncbi:MAG TPA: septal ring lytic transglycosylase RlpA family protein [Solirubrobacteraceae bacterium]|nr:septal ring lytic transglycosylase RlpA family protein [Solirubrobacteraceae bacterium]
MISAAAACGGLASPARADDVGGAAIGDSLLSAAPALVGRPVALTGTLGPAAAGRLISIEALAADGSWQRVATATAAGDGSFSTAWTAPQAGRFTLRAEPAAEVVAAQAVSDPLATATVYRPATATWYDQSGRTGACGVRLRKATLGVAHKSLPCGSLVDVTYAGRSITVPVVDRGPYARGVSYDLTVATARALGMVAAGRARVGVLPQGERTPKTPIAPSPVIGAAGGVTTG